MKSIEHVENLVRFALTKGVGSVTVNRLLRHFGNSENIMSASEAELKEVKGLRSNQIRAVLESRSTNPRLELEMAEDAGVKIIAYDDPSFPRALLECNDPPYLLYVKGEMIARDNYAVGIVGTRVASRYGCAQAQRFGNALAQAGFTIVSGLARGIDTYAHRGALHARGRTIAVVGCGLNHYYPPENRDLYTEISVSGAVISEFTMDTAPGRDTFPRRNRIIAGLSQGVLVVEAPERSGALITSRQAIEMGREVFAIPGQIDQENTTGCHKLIREGAVLVRNTADILKELKQPAKLEHPQQSIARPAPHAGAHQHHRTQSPPPLTNQNKEDMVLSALSTEAEHIDQICARVELGVGEISASLMILELKGLVGQNTGKYFFRINN